MVEITKRSEQDMLVLDCSTDPFNGFERIVKQQLQSHGYQNFRILTGDLSYLDHEDFHIIFYPAFYIEVIELPRHPDSVVSNPDRRWKASCLNGRSRLHRVENYVKIRDRPCFKDMLFTVHAEQFDLEKEKKEIENYHTIDPTIISKYQSLIQDLPKQRRNGDYHSSHHPAYTDSFVNLVTETSVRQVEIFMSEKTFKPFTTGQMALWLGNPGAVNWLRRLGFDVFDDVIDHGYDMVTDWHHRIELIHQQLDRLSNLDLHQLFVDTQERRLYNQQMLYSEKVHEKLLSQANRGLQ